MSNFKRLVKHGGVILITTRSKGFKYQGYPFDFWRYELSDIRAIFSDCSVEVLEKDPQTPGVFCKIRTPQALNENDLTQYRLYSMVTGTMTAAITSRDLSIFKKRYAIRTFLSGALPPDLRTRLPKALPQLLVRLLKRDY